MNTEELPFGRLLYDESKITRGIEIHGRRRRNLAAQAAVYFLVASVLAYVYTNYHGSRPLLDAAGIIGIVFAIVAGVYLTYLAINLGYEKVYEEGVLSTRVFTSGVTFWPFSSLEKISLIAIDNERAYVALFLKQGSKRRLIRSRETFLALKDRIADYEAFVNALEGRVPLENLDS